jgi:FkbM family methyltransferase
MSVRLWWTGARIAARVQLTRALAPLPASLSETVRVRYANAAGLRRRGLSAVVGVLRYRTLAPVREFRLLDNPAVALAAVDNALLKSLYWYGERGYEGAETECWRQLCRRAGSVLELGANVGYYTVQGALAAPGTRYVAVEPNPESAAILRRNLELNGLRSVRVVEAAAVGRAAPPLVELALPDHERYVAPTGAFLVDLREGIADRPARRTVSVPTLDVRELVAAADLIKLDIEGMEADVLAPVLDDVIERGVQVLVEVLTGTPRLRALLLRMMRGGYRIHVVGASTLLELDPYEVETVDLKARYGARDVLATPPRRLDDLEVVLASFGERAGRP